METTNTISPPYVSFVMPVYNASKYIEKAINSIQNQTFTNWELIIIDDASTDDSLKIITKFAEEDERIVVIKSGSNSGHAFTPRRIATMVAKSDLISPLDADDWIDSDYLDQLYSKYKSINADIVYPTMLVEESHRPMRFIPNHKFNFERSYNGKELVKKTLNGWEISANGGLIKKDFYIKCINQVKHSNYIFSDEYLTRVLLINASVVGISKAIYHYRPNDGSITKRVSSKIFELLIADKYLSLLISSSFNENSEENIKIEIQRFFNIVDAIRKFNNIGNQLNSFGRSKVMHMIKTAYTDINWRILKDNIGWRYYYLIKSGITPASIFLKIYDRFSSK